MNTGETVLCESGKQDVPVFTIDIHIRDLADTFGNDMLHEAWRAYITERTSCAAYGRIDVC